MALCGDVIDLVYLPDFLHQSDQIAGVGEVAVVQKEATVIEKFKPSKMWSIRDVFERARAAGTGRCTSYPFSNRNSAR